MQRCLSLLALGAWLLASGGLWEAVQVTGWVRMFAANAQQMSLAEAWEWTFARGQTCEFCAAAQAGRDGQGDETPAPTREAVAQAKQPTLATSALLVAAPAAREQQAGAWPAELAATGGARRDRPATPPPRLA